MIPHDIQEKNYMADDGKTFSVPDVDSPVSFINRQEAGPEPGVAPCLSGGGYRVMVFYLGVLRRLGDGS